MPELPEVEVVRRGLQAHVAGKSISAVRVNHPRAGRRASTGLDDMILSFMDIIVSLRGK